MKQQLLWFFFILGVSLSAQNSFYKADNAWLFGYGSWGNAFMSFNDSLKPVIAKKPLYMSVDFSLASLSDSSGTPLYYSNGFQVIGKDGSYIQGGYRICPCKDLELLGFADSGNPDNQAIIALPINDTLSYLLYEDGGFVNINTDSQYIAGIFYYSRIEHQNNKSELKITKKDVAFNDKFIVSGEITACKHGNGRDWWVIAAESKSNFFQLYLLSESGPVLHKKIAIGSYKFKESGYAFFTQDGTKYIRVTGVKTYDPFTIEIYDFDRCEGTLSNPVIFNQKDNTQTIVFGASVSPNSKYLYVSRHDKLYQYNLDTTNIAASEQLVAVYDGIKSSNGAATFFLQHQLAPDGRIYMSTGNVTSNNLHVIEEPDKRGAACSMKQRAITLPVMNSFTIPNFPNYRLGPLKGSICDSIKTSISSLENFNYGLKCSPNPTSDRLTIEVTLPHYDEKTELVLCDLTGKELIKTVLPDYAYISYMDVSQLSAGMYILQLRQRGWVLKSEKVVVR